MIRVRRFGTLVVCVCLWTVLLTAVAGPVGSDSVGSERQEQLVGFQQGDIEADVFRMEVNLQESGDAEWRVIFRQTLEDETQVQGFEDLRADIEENPDTYLDPFESRMTAIVSEASNETGREMELTALTVETEREQRPQDEIGRVVFSFQWRGFGTVENDSIRAGDALTGLPLDEDEVLQFSWPDSYQVDSVTPGPDTEERHRVAWRGPLTFAAEEPRVEVTPTPESPDNSSSDGTGQPSDDGASETTDTGDNGGGSIVGITARSVVIGAVLLFVISIGVVVLRERNRESEKIPQTAADTATTAETTEATAASAELLSPEEKVLRLLRENDGRMKQKAVGEEIGWSSARTSQVVGQLREQDRVESFRLGRENVLTLPEVDIEADDSDSDSGDENR